VTDRGYKTGDMHPVHNFTAFVEYDESGREIWTSVYGDTEAPYRLANLNAQRRSGGAQMSCCTPSPCTENSQRDSRSAQPQKEHPGAQLRKSQGR
jgi:hypothetical protein